MWVGQDIITQLVMGLVICAILFGVWKITHRGEKF